MKQLFSLAILSFLAPFMLVSTARGQSDSAAHVLRHIVVISFKKDAPADSVRALDNIYQDLAKSSYVKSFEMGTDISTRDPGVLRHVYTTTFATMDDLKSYRKMPEYQMLFKVAMAIADEVNAVDYWTGNPG